ncbi:hypothetical protein [Niabella ginsengisoli]|uniref:Uncharacterized protein n=1 Tax=Niabella ginsengisoli TaxID=522298 RepID=A0ABS9SJ33_9BACT|nr:hypothetical protein [Niabella ginsengisoli]MCH5598378.1 hypothetical protein [Niabella ginsengisoli]
MNKTVLKSIGAILAGFILVAVLSSGTDFLLDKSGILSMEHFKQASFLIVCLVIAYRFTFNVIGCYLIAKLAPTNPMKHVMIMGVIGTILSLLGSIAMWHKAPAFYSIAIILISLPSAWLGGNYI